LLSRLEKSLLEGKGPLAEQSRLKTYLLSQ